MTRRQPPEKLPGEYREIWQALDEAERRASSQQVLARRLRISTFTLQRILVKGDVPRFSEIDNTRIVHAWVRTLTRLAHHFGRRPRDWIEQVGIRWDPVIRRVSEAVAGSLRRDGASEPPVVPDGVTVRSQPETDRWPDRLVVGLADLEPFSLPLPGHSGSFLEVVARRLAGAALPGERLNLRTMSETELVAALAGADPELHLGVGLAGSASLQRHGIAFIPLPGLQVRLSAVCLAGEGEGTEPLPVLEAVDPAAGGEHRFLVVEGSLAHEFLLGQCGIDPGRVIVQPERMSGQLTSTLQEESERRPGVPLILVDTEDGCRRVRDHLEANEGVPDRRTVSVLEGAPDTCPAYPLGAGLPGTSERLHRLLDAALNRELFGSGRRQTAKLYAGLVAAAMRPTDRGIRHDTMSPGGVLLPPAFLETDTLFSQALQAELSGVLTEQPAGAEAGDAVPAGAGQAVTAQTVISGELTVVHCRSCLADLRDPHNHGPSDRYCRHCSDEEGRLRPRAEVHLILARWLMRLQGGIPHEEALRRADAYMKAMPAWVEGD